MNVEHCSNRFPLLSKRWLTRVIWLSKISLEKDQCSYNAKEKSAMVSDFQSDPTGLSQAKFGLCFRSFILLALVDRHSQKDLRPLMLQRVFWILCGKNLLAPKSQEGDLLSTSGETRTDFYVAYPAILTSDRANVYLLCPEVNFKPICGHDCLGSLNNFASHTHVMTLARFLTLRRNSKNPLTVICWNHGRIDFTRLCALLAFPGSSSPRFSSGSLPP